MAPKADMWEMVKIRGDSIVFTALNISRKAENVPSETVYGDIQESSEGLTRAIKLNLISRIQKLRVDLLSGKSAC